MRLKVRNWSPIALLLLVPVLAACSGGEADIALADTNADLGIVVNGEVREFATEVQNAGREPLIIEAVTTSCGCTSATVEPDTIPAGGTGVLSITYDSGAHGPDFAGSVRRQVFIASNDPDQRETVFEIEVQVLPPDG